MGVAIPKCPCPCGEFDLADGQSLGVWTIADAAAEYRSCNACKATLPYMPPLEVEGQRIDVFHDPSASEPIRYEDVEWANLLDAIAVGPPATVAELRREGVVLARAFVGIDGVIGWRVLPPI